MNILLGDVESSLKLFHLLYIDLKVIDQKVHLNIADVNSKTNNNYLYATGLDSDIHYRTEICKGMFLYVK